MPSDDRIREVHWLAYDDDVGRVRAYAEEHRLGDSATALRAILDERERLAAALDPAKHGLIERAIFETRYGETTWTCADAAAAVVKVLTGE